MQQAFQSVLLTLDRINNSTVTPLSILHCRLYTGHVRCEIEKVQFLVIKDWKENFPLLGQETPAKRWVHLL